MKYILTTCVFVAVQCIVFPFNNYSQPDKELDWAQFRGALRNGTSSEEGLYDTWPADGPELMWKTAIGSGFSEVIISGNTLYTTMGYNTDSVSGKEYIAAFNAENGEQIWRTEIDSLFIDVDNWGNGPRSTPVVDKSRVYCLSSYGKLGAYSLVDGKEIWQIDFVKDLNSPVPRWGFSCSPVLFNNDLIIEAGGNDSRAFISVNTETGDIKWSKGDGEPYYCSPIKANLSGEEQIIFANGGLLSSYTVNGDTLWTYGMPFRGPTAIPVFIEPDKLFVSTVGPIGFFLISVSDNKVSEVLTGNTMQNHWSSTSYHDGYLYGFSNASLQCISATDGSVTWKKRGFGKGSLIILDNKLIVLSDKGKLILIDTNPEIYSEISSFQAIDGKSWTAPSFSNGRIFLRNLTEMVAYKLK